MHASIAQCAVPDEIPRDFRPFFQYLANTWFVKNTVEFPVPPFTDGYSGAFVTLISLGPSGESKHSHKDEILQGDFVLKLDRRYGDRTEADQHEAARLCNEKWAKKHMLVLRRQETSLDHGSVALLYDVAGHKVRGTQSPENMDAGELKSCIRQVAKSLVSEWNPLEVGKSQSAWEFVEQWSGKRLRDERLLEVQREVTQGTSIIRFGDRILLNPLHLGDTPAGRERFPGSPIQGMLHGDLHLRNILAPKRQDSGDFWLIDFAYSHKGFLLYDHAYLEVSLLLSNPERFRDGSRLYKLLVALDERNPDSRSWAAVAPDDFCVLDCIRGLRYEIEKWSSISASTVKGSVETQFLLARVSAGLNWANKPLELADRKTAFIYAAWAAHQFNKENTPDEAWWQFFKNVSLCPQAPP